MGTVISVYNFLNSYIFRSFIHFSHIIFALQVVNSLHTNIICVASSDLSQEGTSPFCLHPTNLHFQNPQSPPFVTFLVSSGVFCPASSHFKLQLKESEDIFDILVNILCFSVSLLLLFMVLHILIHYYYYHKTIYSVACCTASSYMLITFYYKF
jgi:hypothetical protein